MSEGRAPELTAYLAAEGFTAELLEELGDVQSVHERLVLAEGPPRPAAWAQNTWLDARRIPIESIGDANRALRAIQRNWALYSFDHHRRAQLIEAALPPIRFRPHRFGAPAPVAPLGSFTLLDRETLLASSRCSSPFPHGAVSFEEDREAPPSRAYLKLWEVFTLLGVQPKEG